jgi:hypothetical protein
MTWWASLAHPLTATFQPGDISEGVRFHPGGFPALSGIPARELVDVRLPIADVLPRFRSLRRLAQDAPPPDPLAQAAYQARDIRALCQATGYSERQLRRRVLAATGHGAEAVDADRAHAGRIALRPRRELGADSGRARLLRRGPHRQRHQ